MTFTPNIPASGETLGASRTEVLNNFASLRSTISNAVQPNHIDVNNTGAGKHIFVQMPVQVAGAANLPAATEGGLITQTVAGKSELFYARDGVATYNQITAGDTATSGTNRATFLPGGIRVKLGSGQITAGNSSVTISYAGTALSTVINAIVGVSDVNSAATPNPTIRCAATTSQIVITINGTVSAAGFVNVNYFVAGT